MKKNQLYWIVRNFIGELSDILNSMHDAVESCLEGCAGVDCEEYQRMEPLMALIRQLHMNKTELLELIPDVYLVPDEDQHLLDRYERFEYIPSGQLLEFTCPKCGGHRLEEIVLMRQEIEAVIEPDDPKYAWDYEQDAHIPIGRSLYTGPYDGNSYRCRDCKAELQNEYGVGWGGDFLIEWLISNSWPDADDSASPNQAST